MGSIMKWYVAVLLSGCANFLGAQNFQNICTQGTTLYQGHDLYYKAFRLDSTVVSGNSDSLFYSYRAIRDSSEFAFICRDTTNGDALGRKIFKRHDGWFWFFNMLNDTIKINSQAGLLESWKFCSLPDSDFCYLQATVSAIDLDSVAGTVDTVKVISFQAKNAFGSNIACIFNQKSIRLSRQYGLSKLYDLYWTPYDTLALELIGKTTPVTGVQPFGWTDVYNYNVGDEFHYSGHHAYGSAAATWKMIKRVLEKTVYGNTDSVRYRIERCKKTWYPAPPPNTVTLHDTVEEFYNFILMAGNPVIRLLPDEFYPSSMEAAAISRTNGVYNNRQAQIYNLNGYFRMDSCYNDPFEVWGPVTWYVPGLGEARYMYAYFDITVEQYDNHLVYFNKGSETWGWPVATDCPGLVTKTDEVSVPVTAEASPNPATTATRISLSSARNDERFQYALYNSMGTRVGGGRTESNPFTLQRNGLKPGLYLLIITDMQGIKKGTAKIIFE